MVEDRWLELPARRLDLATLQTGQHQQLVWEPVTVRPKDDGTD